MTGKFQCPICALRFDTKEVLEEHKKLVHFWQRFTKYGIQVPPQTHHHFEEMSPDARANYMRSIQDKIDHGTALSDMEELFYHEYYKWKG